MAEDGQAERAAAGEREEPGLAAPGGLREAGAAGNPLVEGGSKGATLGGGDAASIMEESKGVLLGGGDAANTMEGGLGGGDAASSMEASKEGVLGGGDPASSMEESKEGNLCGETSPSSMEESNEGVLGGGDPASSMEESNEGVLGGGDTASSMEESKEGVLCGETSPSSMEEPKEGVLCGETSPSSMEESKGLLLGGGDVASSMADSKEGALGGGTPTSSIEESKGGLLGGGDTTSSMEESNEDPANSVLSLSDEGGLDGQAPASLTEVPREELLEGGLPDGFTEEPMEEEFQGGALVASKEVPMREGPEGAHGSSTDVPVEEKLDGGAPGGYTEEAVEGKLEGGVPECSMEEGLEGGALEGSTEEPMEEKLYIGACEGSTEMTVMERLEAGAHGSSAEVPEEKLEGVAPDKCTAVSLVEGLGRHPFIHIKPQGDDAQESPYLAMDVTKEQGLVASMVPVTMAMEEGLEARDSLAPVQAIADSVQSAPASPLKVAEEKARSEPESPLKVTVAEKDSPAPSSLKVAEKTQSAPASPMRETAEAKTQLASESPIKLIAHENIKPSSPVKVVEDGKAQSAPESTMHVEVESAHPAPGSPMKVTADLAQLGLASPKEVATGETAQPVLVCPLMVAVDKVHPASPIKLVADEKAQPAIASPVAAENIHPVSSPVKLPLEVAHPPPGSPMKVATEVKAQPEPASPLKLQVEKEMLPTPVDPIQPAAKKGEQALASAINLIGEEEAEMGPASPLKLALEEQAHASPITLVAEEEVEMAEEEAEMAPASPIKLAVEEALQAPTGPIKVLAEVKAPESPIQLTAEEPLHIPESPLKVMWSASPVKLASEKEVVEAPTSALTPVAEKEATQALMSPLKLVAEEEAEQAPASPLMLGAERAGHADTNPLTWSAGHEAEQAPKSPSIQAAGREAMEVAAGLMTQATVKEAPQIPAGPVKPSAEGALPVLASSPNHMNERDVPSSLVNLPKQQEEEVLVAPVNLMKLMPPVTVAEEHGLEGQVTAAPLDAKTSMNLANEEDGIQATTVATPVVEGLKAQLSPMKVAAERDPQALTSPTKTVTGGVLEVRASLLNGAAEETTKEVLASPKKQEVEEFQEASDRPPKRVAEGMHVFANPQKSEEDPEALINPKKRPAEDDSDALAKPKRQAAQEVTEILASCYQAVEQQVQITNSSQESVLVTPEAPDGPKWVTEEEQQCPVNSKKRAADEEPGALASHKKRAVEEGTENLINLKKRGAEEELETLTHPKRWAAEAVGEIPDTQGALVKVSLELPTSPQRGVTQDKSIPETQLVEDSLKAPPIPEKQGAVGDLKPLVAEDAQLVPSVSETPVTEEALKAMSIPEGAAEDLQAQKQVSGDRPSCLSVPGEGPNDPSSVETLVASSGLQEPQKSVVTDGAEDEGDEGAQEYPGSPMDLVEDEDSNTCDTLMVGEIVHAQPSSVYLEGTSQGAEAVSDCTSEQSPSLATEGFNGSAYLGHNASLYPVTAADGTSLPFPPEFDKHWKATQDSPSDFTAWTDLLQYVEQENHLVAARKSFTAFFGRYPYCYGYWKKYADMEQRFGFMKEAEEVYEQGLQAIPLSVDLWMHFITFLQETMDMSQQESLQKLCNIFEMALAAAGMDFRSDKLWEMYASWEREQGDLQAVTVIYDRVLSTPTQLYSHHFEKFREHVTNNSPADILSREEFMWLRSKLVPEAAPVVATMGTGDQALGQEGGEEAAQVAEIEKQNDVDQQKMRELIISLREQMYKQNEAEVSKRWAFEDGIKRPYFHVKPLERAQLKNWRDYLDFEIANGSHTRTIVLFERCVIACALYEDFWLKYTKYLENHTVIGTRSVFQRSCLYHLPRKPNLHLLWAAFEERQGDIEEARNILKTLDETVPGLAMVRLRRVSLERRIGNLEAAEELLREAIRDSAGTSLAGFYSIKLARQVLKVQNNLSKARQVLQEALEKDPDNAKLYLNLLELEFSADVKQNEGNTMDCIEKVLNSNLPTDTKIVFSQRRVEFLEDFGSSLKSLLTAYDEHQKLLKLQSPKRKATENGSAEEPDEKKAKTDEVPAPASAPAPPVITTASSSSLMGDMSTSQIAASAAYNYNTWYQNYGAYSYQNTWNYNYYPQS